MAKGAQDFKMNREASQDISSVTLVVPFYNEEASVVPLAERMYPVIEELGRRWSVQLVLIDDGSTDDTYARLRRSFRASADFETTILRHIENRGIGAAMATGFEAASGDIICTLDCDCSYRPEELPGMIDFLIDQGADLVTASPYHPLGEVHNAKPWRIFMSKTASRVYSWLSPVKLHCYTSFFRVYRREWANPEYFEAEGFTSVAEVLLRASACGARVAEYPTTLGLRSEGSSKLRVPLVTLQHLHLMAKTALRRSEPGLDSMGASLDGEDAADTASLLDHWVLVGRVRGHS